MKIKTDPISVTVWLVMGNLFIGLPICAWKYGGGGFREELRPIMQSIVESNAAEDLNDNIGRIVVEDKTIQLSFRESDYINKLVAEKKKNEEKKAVEKWYKKGDKS